ncbi:serine hydrolase domain-containing protein [Actinoplanes auranticolor]|uniref:Serine hydrolase n=1 Tax=Actinoplanes auranticolor TaxID=47988 RepID=A0A919S484_9ACTN|nr:serine hydrolase domain-containing protein [Actinoplanes auranticolor]GIM64056.1 serine hydrolase [Actinoplanes auranticolor]
MIGVALRSALDERVAADILTGCARRHRVPGAQLAIHQGGATVTAEYGEDEYGTGRRVTAHTAFPVGSITKAVTATTVLALVADGDLELDEPVGRLLSDLTGAAARITVRQLLSHTSGLPCGPAAEDAAGLSVPRYLARACRPELMVLPPGTAFSYSNVGYVLLGRLITVVTGMSWADAIQSIVLEPLGVTPGLIAAAGPRRTLAIGHSVNERTGRVRPVRQSLPEAEAAAGALALSAADLVALGRLHVDGGVPSVLPAGYAARMRSVVPGAVPFGLARGWGLGLAAFGVAPDEWFGHDGNADGTGCFWRIDADGGQVVALTCNAGSGHAMWADLTAELRDAGIAMDDALPAADVRFPGTSAPECAGSYLNGDLEYRVIAGGPFGLRLSIDGETAENIVVRADLTFHLEDASTGRWTLGGRFVRDQRSRVVNGIQVGGRLGGRRIEALV